MLTPRADMGEVAEGEEENEMEDGAMPEEEKDD